MKERIRQLENLNHILRNGIMEMEGILRKMNKALKKYEEEISNDSKTKTK